MTSDATRYPAAATSNRRRSLAAIQNQAATVPGQHGVPFRRSGGAQGRSATPTQTIPTTSPGSNKQVPPLPTASRETISNFIRQQRVCFRHAFGVPCHGCKFSHEAIPAGLYRDAHLYAQRPKPTWGQPQQRVAQPAPDSRTQELLSPDVLDATLNALTYVFGGTPFDEEEQGNPTTTSAETAEEDDDYAALQQNKDGEQSEEDGGQDSYPPRRPFIF